MYLYIRCIKYLGENIYVYTMIRNMPHGVERHIAQKAWYYIKQFARKENGSLFKVYDDNTVFNQ